MDVQNDLTVMGPYIHFDGFFILYFSLDPLLFILATNILIRYPSLSLHLPRWLVGSSLIVVHSGCILLLWYCLRVLVHVLLLTSTDPG